MKKFQCKQCTFNTTDRVAMAAHYRTHHRRQYDAYSRGSETLFIDQFVMTELLVDVLTSSIAAGSVDDDIPAIVSSGSDRSDLDDSQQSTYEPSSDSFDSGSSSSMDMGSGGDDE